MSRPTDNTVLHFITPEDDPEIAVRAFTKRLVPGICLAVSHVTSDGTHPSVIAAIEDAYKTASAPAVFRTPEQIHGFFDGLSLVSPGLADMMSWRARYPPLRSPRRCGCWPASPAARHRVRGDKARSAVAIVGIGRGGAAGVADEHLCDHLERDAPGAGNRVQRCPDIMTNQRDPVRQFARGGLEHRVDRGQQRDLAGPG